MQSMPLEATAYFHSHVMRGLKRGLRREHALRDDTWLRLHVLSGALTLVEGRTHSRTVLAIGEDIDIAPGVSHHFEQWGPSVQFTVDLFRVKRDKATRDETSRWESEGGRADDPSARS